MVRQTEEDEKVILEIERETGDRIIVSKFRNGSNGGLLVEIDNPRDDDYTTITMTPTETETLTQRLNAYLLEQGR